MKSSPFAAFESVLGKWKLKLINSWFLKDTDPDAKGVAIFELLDGLMVFRFGSGKTPSSVSVIGYSDAQKKYEMFYYDNRNVYRIFDVQRSGSSWIMTRKDKDFYQRMRITIKKGVPSGRAEASDNKGKTWRKDFDMVFMR
jgi:hypothetical protein